MNAVGVKCHRVLFHRSTTSPARSPFPVSPSSLAILSIRRRKTFTFCQTPSEHFARAFSSRSQI